MLMAFSQLTRKREPGRMVALYAAFEAGGAYIGTFTLDDLHRRAQAQAFWINRTRYLPAGCRLDEAALEWHPNGFAAGMTLFDFDGFRLSPVRERKEDDCVETCQPGQCHFWAIYGFHRQAQEWQLVHDAQEGEAGEALARIVDLTGDLVEYRDDARAYANTRLADLPRMIADRLSDSDCSAGDRIALSLLRDQIAAALAAREA